MIRRSLSPALLLLALLAGVAAGGAFARGPHQSATTGYVDPTESTFNTSRPMVSCAGSCSTSLVNQNTDALQAALDLAAAGSHPWVYLPPGGEYPIARGGASHNQFYGVQLLSKSQVTIVGYGATLRDSTPSSDAGSDFYMLRVDNSSNIRVYGLTWSQRDHGRTPVPEQTHMIRIGNQNSADDVQVVDCRFVDGKGGDAINLLGGNTEANSVKRLAIARNYIDGKRAGTVFQHGVSKIAIEANDYGPNGTDQLIDFEPTSIGGDNFVHVIGNRFRRPTGNTTTGLTFGGYSEGDTLVHGANYNVWAYNTLDNVQVSGLDTYGTWFVGNKISNTITGCLPTLSVFRRADYTWIVDGNAIDQRCTVSGNTNQIVLFSVNATFAPTQVWVAGNALHQYQTGAVGGVSLQPARYFHVTDNVFEYHGATSNAFIPIVATSEGTLGSGLPGVTSGNIRHNTMRRGLQTDNVTLAGTMQVGIDFSIGSQAKIGFGSIRDNFSDGAQKLFAITQTGASPLLEGVPVLSGNIGLNASGGDNLPTYYRTESTGLAESVNTATASPSRLVHFLEVGTVALPDGARDGDVHEFKDTDAVTGTLTPTNFGDGTSISWTAKARWSMAWDVASGKWWLLDHSGTTVNP